MLVSDKRAIVIKDACILFDLIDLNILGHFYLLDLIVYTTPQVIDEITNDWQLTQITEYINKGKLLVDNHGEILAISAIYGEYAGLSFTDSSVLELAERIDGAIVLSSDGSLRKASQKRNIDVRGVLWIIDQLFNCGHLTREETIMKLTQYPEFNDRVPMREIQSMIAKLKSI